MSCFLSNRLKCVTAYVPGEQPLDKKYLKLNTNESPFSPHPEISRAVAKKAESLNLYCDPDSSKLRLLLAEKTRLRPENIIVTNSGDEALNYAFAAFCDDDTPAFFPDLTYGFYRVFADFHGVEHTEISLKDNFLIDTDDYKNISGTIFIANPNAPTGLCLSIDQIKEILNTNHKNVVVIDEAYVDFGGKSSDHLVDEYQNLLVVHTFSKSRSLAGMRLGYAIGNPDLIADLKVVQYSTNPYNVSSLAQEAGISCLTHEDYYQECVEKIIQNRAWLINELDVLGFEILESKTNFIFVNHKDFPADSLYVKLKNRGVLIRHFNKSRIADWNRISIGSMQQMQHLVYEIKELLSETQ